MYVFFHPVVREFCRISLEFILKGSNPKVYQAAARKFLNSYLAHQNDHIVKFLFEMHACKEYPIYSIYTVYTALL